MVDRGPAMGARAAAVSVAAGVVGALIGGLGTAGALALVPGTWSESAQLVAISAPAGVAAALGVGAALAGVVAAFRSGLSRWPGPVGALGALLGGAVVAGAVGWWLFLGGLSLLAAFAWH